MIYVLLEKILDGVVTRDVSLVLWHVDSTGVLENATKNKKGLHGCDRMDHRIPDSLHGCL
jgi:hypothetical protein